MTFGQQSGSRQYLHYNPDRTDYSLTADELTRLESAGSNLWKDVCLVSTSLGLSCIINAISGTGTPFVLSIALFLNYLFGVLGLASAVVFGIQWFKTQKAFKQVVSEIKNKPKMEIIPSTTNVGALQAMNVPPTTD